MVQFHQWIYRFMTTK